MENLIRTILLRIGVPAHIQGYNYLVEAISLVYNNPQNIFHLTKNVYSAVAIKFFTTESKVERAIRNALEIAWSRGNVEYLNKLFGFEVCQKKFKLPTGEFIALIKEKLLMDNA